MELGCEVVNVVYQVQAHAHKMCTVHAHTTALVVQIQYTLDIHGTTITCTMATG